MKNVNFNLQVPEGYGLAIVLIPPCKARLREPEPIETEGEAVDEEREVA